MALFKNVSLVWVFFISEGAHYLLNSHPYSAMASESCTSLLDFDAIGDGVHDDTSAMRKAVNSGLSCLTGNGRLFLTKGFIPLANNLELRNMTLLQSPSEHAYVRTIEGQNVNNVILRGVRVIRHESNEPIGDNIARAAAIWLRNVQNIELIQVEITGDGKGAGIFIVDSENVAINRAYIHSMRWRAETVPRYEVLFGLRLARVSSARIIAPKIHDLVGKIGQEGDRPFQTDGITIGGSYDITIENADIRRTGEGIDFTGTLGNEGFRIIDSYTEDIDSFGYKFANSARNGYITGSNAVRSGYAGFVVSGPGQQDVRMKTRSIRIEDCEAIDTGFSGRWKSYPTSGFLIIESKLFPGHPREINIIRSVARDTQERKTMKYGFLNLVKNSSPPNTVTNVDSFGHIVEGSRGF